MTADAGGVVEVFCDGSCLGNPGPGGWAALLRTRGRDGIVVEKMLSGGAPDTTNNRMELAAAIHALQALKRSCTVRVTTDSNYVVQGMTSWIHGWQKRSWKNSAGKPVENQDLWRDLLAAGAPHTVTWHWVRGHAGHVENERCDEVARREAGRSRDGVRAGRS